MKRISAIVIAVVLALGLTACKSGTVSTTTTTVSNGVDSDSIFIAALNTGDDPTFQNLSSDLQPLAIKLAKAQCQLYAGGGTPTDSLTIMQQNGFTSLTDDGFFIGAAIGAYCPNYSNLIGQ